MTSRHTLTVALAQIDTIVGDLTGNARLVAAAIERAHARDVDLLVFPELTLIGYPPRDLLERRALADAAQRHVERLARLVPPGMVVLVGSIDWPAQSVLPRNVAHVLEHGTVATVCKRLLPTYDVFDEARHFAPGVATQQAVFVVKGISVGVLVCEDIWNDAELWGDARRYAHDPAEELVQAGAQLLVDLSASPFNIGKPEVRAEVVRHCAKRHRVSVAMCNLVGGNDSLVFDGGSMLANPDGSLVAVAAAFAEDFLLAGWERDRGFRVDDANAVERAGSIATGRLRHSACRIALDERELDDLEAALTLGLKDYMRKLGFQRVVLGLSGGIDSALVACIAARAIGGERVLAVEMPSSHTSELSRAIADELIDNLGLAHAVLPIADVQDAFLRTLAPAFGTAPADVTEENLQARVRGSMLMALSNKFGHLLLSTGNKSEMAVGYCTLYGDMNGGLSLIGDVYKQQVYALCRRINERAGATILPQAVLDRPPSAELRPGQTDQDSLPPYARLDPILAGIIEDRLEDEAIHACTDSPIELVRCVRGMVDRAEFKRYQAAPPIRVSSKAWHGRRYPIIHRFDAARESTAEPTAEPKGSTAT